MYEFVDRLITIALPRVRDFRGLNPKSFDGRGNYSLGIKEHIIFPEIDYDKASDVWGMDITVCTTRAAPTTRRARCWPHSTSRSGSEAAQTDLRRGDPGDLNGEEEFDREEQPAAQDGEAISGRRARLKAIASDKDKPMEERFAASLKLAELPRNSSPDAHPQSLRGDAAGRAPSTASSR